MERFFFIIRVSMYVDGFQMISNQEILNLSPYAAIYDIFVSKDNMLRQMNELVDFSFILEELKTKYCLDNNEKTIKFTMALELFKKMYTDTIQESNNNNL